MGVDGEVHQGVQDYDDDQDSEEHQGINQVSEQDEGWDQNWERGEDHSQQNRTHAHKESLGWVHQVVGSPADRQIPG